MVEKLRELRPLRHETWAPFLEGEEPAEREFLLYCLEHGVPLVSPVVQLPSYTCRNYKSALEYASQVSHVIQADLQQSRVFPRPVSCAPSPYVHALGAIPKTVPPVSEVRIIHDHSRPAGLSLNDHITYVHLEWASIDDAFDLMTPGCYMAKVDISEYYRHFWVDPSDWNKQAFSWDLGEGPVELWDAYLQFGLRHAPEVAHRFTCAILGIMRRQGFHRLVGIMDDFLVMADTYDECMHAWLTLKSLLERLGFRVNAKAHKSVPPSQRQKFVGVLLDSLAMQAKLDGEKLSKAQVLLTSFIPRAKCTQGDVQELVGFLQWCSKVVYGGRAFLRRLIDLQNSVSKPWHHVRVSEGARADAIWWLEEGLPRFNGAAMIVSSTPVSPVCFQCDACGAGGMGVFLEGGFVGLTLAQVAAMFDDAPPPGQHIAVYETFVILVAVRLFPLCVVGCHLGVRSDNTETVAAVNKFTARRPLVMQYMRELFSLSVSLQFRISATHLPGRLNGLADALSRQDWRRFRGLLLEWRQQQTAQHSPHVSI